MKKFAVFASTLGYFISAAVVFAQQQRDVKVTFPGVGIDPATRIGTLISNALLAIFIIGALLVLFMLVWGAVQWIISGGDKERVASARGRIIAALVGLALLALAFLITVVVGQVLRIDLLRLPALPRLDQAPGSTSTSPQ